MDFLSIGGTVIDTFIRLKDAEVHCEINQERCTICMRFADKIPFESAVVVPAVGNSANAAVAVARLGLSSALITGLGKDRGGEDCLEVFRRERVATDYISIDAKGETMNNYVLWYGPDRTILVKYSDFGYVLPDPFPAIRALYVSSIDEANFGVHDLLVKILAARPETLLMFQPATFHIQAGIERLKEMYARTDYLFANKEEYQRILSTKEENPRTLMELMRKIGPKVAIMTDGEKGAYASDGTHAYFVPSYPQPKPAYDRTGAGDAFASTVSAAILLGHSLPEALLWGPVNSMCVVQEVGAQKGLLTREALKHYLEIAPPEYKVTSLA